MAHKSAFSRYENPCFTFATERRLEGIISYSTGAFGGNVGDLGMMNVTVNSTKDDKPANIGRNTRHWVTDLFFCSADSPSHWLCLNFGLYRVTPMHYSLKANVDSNDCRWRILLSLVIGGPEDGQSWAVLNKHEDNRQLCARNVTNSWPASNTKNLAFFCGRLARILEGIPTK